MHPRRLPVLGLLVLLLGAVISCRSPLEGGPGARFVSASRAAHDLWAGRLKLYIAADPSLDPLLRDQLEKSLDDWTLALEAAEEAIRPDLVGGPELPAAVPR